MTKLRKTAIEIIGNWLDQQSTLSDGDKEFYKEELRGYEVWFGENALIGLAGYIKWAKKKEVPNATIRFNVLHDLSGIGDELKSPRTRRYGEYLIAYS